MDAIVDGEESATADGREVRDRLLRAKRGDDMGAETSSVGDPQLLDRAASFSEIRKRHETPLLSIINKG
jgi:hypothetical protein